MKASAGPNVGTVAGAYTCASSNAALSLLNNSSSLTRDISILKYLIQVAREHYTRVSVLEFNNEKSCSNIQSPTDEMVVFQFTLDVNN